MIIDHNVDLLNNAFIFNDFKMTLFCKWEILLKFRIPFTKSASFVVSTTRFAVYCQR